MATSRDIRTRITRRRFLRSVSLAGVTLPLLAACAPAAPPQPTPAPAKPTEAPKPAAPTAAPAPTPAAAPTQAPAVAKPTPAPAPAAGQRRAGGTLNVWLPNGWPEQAWHLLSNWESGWAIGPMADVLFWVKPDGSLEPMLGESVTASPDGLKWTLKLKRGLKWSDGRPITAADYEYGVLARFSPDNKPLNELRNGRNIKGIQAYVKGEAKNVEGIKVVDDTTVEISLDAPDATMRTLWFGDTLIMPLPKHAIGEIPFRDLGRDKYWITSPLASGPYRFVRYQTDQFIEYERNPNYWDDKPRPDRLFMRIASPEVAIVSLEKGEIDLINPLALTEVARLKGLPNVEVVEAKNNAQWYGLERNFKVKNGIWRNPKAVQGLLHAVDRQAYVNSILQGYGVVRNSFYDGTPYQCPTLKKYDYNPDRAKQLWQEVGMPQDQVISFMSWPGIKARMDFLPIAQEYVRKLGYKSEVDFIDNSLIQDYIQGKGPRGENWDFHVLLFGPGSDPGTPESFIDPNSTSNWAYRSWPEPPGPDGRKKPEWVYNNPKLLELYRQGKTESDPQKRIPIYQQADCIWNEELPCIMIASPSFMIAKSKRLQGLDWQTNAGLALWTRMYKPGDWWIAG